MDFASSGFRFSDEAETRQQRASARWGVGRTATRSGTHDSQQSAADMRSPLET